jgi:hypothetical protein
MRRSQNVVKKTGHGLHGTYLSLKSISSNDTSLPNPSLSLPERALLLKSKRIGFSDLLQVTPYHSQLANERARMRSLLMNGNVSQKDKFQCHYLHGNELVPP